MNAPLAGPFDAAALDETLDDAAAEVAEVLGDLPSFGGLVEIKTKDDGKVAFGWDRWHPEQRRFECTRTGRDIVLKPRQIGFSTLELLRDLQFARTHDGVQVVVVVHTEAAKTELFAAVHLMVRTLAAWGLLPPASETRENSKHGIRWDDNDSSIKVIEAGKDEAVADDRGRSGTVHRLHATEVAFYKAPEATMTALMAAAKGGEIVVESTANGVGNWFHEKVLAARRGAFAGFRFHFFPWFEHPGYRCDPALYPDPPETKRRQYWEQRLRSLGCDDWQIAWWRETVEEHGLDKALREYPPTADAAFEASGDTWIEPEHLDRMESTVRKPIEFFEVRRPERKAHDGSVIPARRFADLRVYRRPEPGKVYILTGDPSGGVGRDEAAGLVIEWRSAEVCAAWDDNHTAPGDFGNALAAIGRYYNTALIASEIQLDGRAGRETNAVLVREERYPRVFAYKPGELGWSTDEITRPVLFGDLEKLIRDGRIDPVDEKLASEFRTLVVDPKTQRVQARGKGTKSGADDGLVICIGIAIQVRLRSPMPGKVRASNSGALQSPGFRT